MFTNYAKKVYHYNNNVNNKNKLMKKKILY